MVSLSGQHGVFEMVFLFFYIFFHHHVYTFSFSMAPQNPKTKCISSAFTQSNISNCSIKLNIFDYSIKIEQQLMFRLCECRYSNYIKSDFFFNFMVVVRDNKVCVTLCGGGGDSYKKVLFPMKANEL
jgi:hypothetical protein